MPVPLSVTWTKYLKMSNLISMAVALASKAGLFIYLKKEGEGKKMLNKLVHLQSKQNNGLRLSPTVLDEFDNTLSYRGDDERAAMYGSGKIMNYSWSQAIRSLEYFEDSYALSCLITSLSSRRMFRSDLWSSISTWL